MGISNISSALRGAEMELINKWWTNYLGGFGGPHDLMNTTDVQMNDLVQMSLFNILLTQKKKKDYYCKMKETQTRYRDLNPSK